MISSTSSKVSSYVAGMAKRAFSTTSVTPKEFAHITVRKQKKLVPLEVGIPRSFLPKQKPLYPEYPYGKAVLFKQSDRGLYGGQTIQFGNQISEFRNKSRRTWLPNINRHKLWSETLRRDINIKTTSRVLRTITKEGGIDRYLTKDKSSRIKGLGITGWRLRYKVLSKQEAQDKASPKIIEEVQSADKTIPVFFKHTTASGSEVKITVGRRKLLQYLFNVLNGNKDEKAQSFRVFISAYGSKSSEEIISLLDQNSFDLSKISV